MGSLTFTLGLEAAQFLKTGNEAVKVIQEIGSSSGHAGATGESFGNKLVGMATKFTILAEAAHEALEIVSKVIEAVLHKLEQGFEFLVGQVERTWKVIEQGAALEALSKRTSTAVLDLYRLREGMAYASVSAEEAAPMLFQMQKALGGISETGESTKDVFSKLGLSISELKAKSPAAAFQDIVRALAQLSPESAAKAASMIFGRAGAQSAVQLSRSLDDFNSGMERANTRAAIFARNATSFERAEKAIGDMKNRVVEFYLAVAEGLAPALEKVANWVNSLNLMPIGQKIGTVIAAITQSLQDGSFIDVMFDSATAFFESLPELFASLSLKITAILIRGLREVAVTFGSLLFMAWDRVEHEIAKFSGLGAIFGNPKPAKYGDVRATIGGAVDGVLPKGLPDVFDQSASGWFKLAKLAWKDVGANMSDLAKKGIAAANAGGKENSTETDVEFASPHVTKSEGGSTFEKMGFVMSGGMDHTQQIALNTRRSAELLAIIAANTAIPGQGPAQPMHLPT